MELLVDVGDLRGRRVLDVGCGTGRLAAALAERFRAKVWAVDPTHEMLEIARRRVPAGVGLKAGRAEDLPFRERWFERVTMSLVLHHVDPPRALAEIRRVLVPGGRLAILTFDPAQIRGYYLNRFFPSIRGIDLARFPQPGELEAELRAAGFDAVETVHHRQEQAIGREEALERIRGKHISTFQLVPADEYDEGLARAERELPERIEYEQHWLLAVASSP